MKEKFPSIYKEPIETLQINIGYRCNQACKHCHVNSSPLRTEKMSKEILSLIPKIIEKYKIKTLDITGGAPELHPEFKNLINSLSTKQVDIIFKNGPKEYISWFIELANKRSNFKKNS